MILNYTQNISATLLVCDHFYQRIPSGMGEAKGRMLLSSDFSGQSTRFLV